jgi:hypothetical protein
MKNTALLCSTLVALGLSAQVAHADTQLPNLEHLRILVNAVTGDRFDDPTNTRFARTKPMDENPFTRLAHDVVKTAEALVDVHVPAGETYGQHLHETANASLSDITGTVGDTVDDGVLLVNSEELKHRGYVKNPEVLQCSGDLPLEGLQDLGGMLGISQMKHIWIQANGTSYGMPYTVDRTYMGGDSLIYSPDEFQNIYADVPDVSCTPVYQPKEISREDFTKAFSCIADSVAHFSDKESSTVTFLDYSVFKHNCLSASRFLVECTGGEIAQDPNLGIGGHFGWDFEIKKATISAQNEQAHAQLYNILAQFDAAAEAVAVPSSVPDPKFAQNGFTWFISRNSDLVEQFRQAIVVWLDTKPADLRGQTKFIGRDTQLLGSKATFNNSLRTLGWTGFYQSIQRLEEDLTVRDFQQGSVSKESLGELCNQVRTSCGLPELDLKR